MLEIYNFSDNFLKVATRSKNQRKIISILGKN